MHDLTSYREAAQQAARNAAAVLAEWRGKFNVREKGRADLVSEADVNAQEAVRAYLVGRFPDHEFLGEEGPKAARPGKDAPPTWIVDPLDGTTNYVHDIPMYCVSIGLQIAGEMVVGVVYEPSRNEMFHAAVGQGAWLNDQRMKTSTTQRLDQALLSTGFPPDIRQTEHSLDWWRYFSFHARSLRRTGSTAINLAWLAAGRFDAHYAFDNHAWDVAGGIVLIREAGGIVTNTDGSPFDAYTPDILATNGPLHTGLLEVMRNDPRKM